MCNACGEWGEMLTSFKDPILSLINGDIEVGKKADDIRLIAVMNVEYIKGYEGKYKLDVERTFRNEKVESCSEDSLQNWESSEEFLTVLFLRKNGGGGIGYFDSFFYLKNAESIRHESIEGREYVVVVNEGVSEYWEKVED